MAETLPPSVESGKGQEGCRCFILKLLNYPDFYIIITVGFWLLDSSLYLASSTLRTPHLLYGSYKANESVPLLVAHSPRPNPFRNIPTAPVRERRPSEEQYPLNTTSFQKTQLIGTPLAIGFLSIKYFQSQVARVTRLSPSSLLFPQEEAPVWLHEELANPTFKDFGHYTQSGSFPGQTNIFSRVVSRYSYDDQVRHYN